MLGHTVYDEPRCLEWSLTSEHMNCVATELAISDNKGDKLTCTVCLSPEVLHHPTTPSILSSSDDIAGGERGRWRRSESSPGGRLLVIPFPRKHSRGSGGVWLVGRTPVGPCPWPVVVVTWARARRKGRRTCAVGEGGRKKVGWEKRNTNKCSYNTGL